FDAVAALAGVRQRVSFEGQAAMELEWLATDLPADGTYPFEVDATDGGAAIDCRPLIREVAKDSDGGWSAAFIGRSFHSAVVDLIAKVCERLRTLTDLDAVVLSGGVFLNALLTRETTTRLRDMDFRVYRHRLVPPNDGGLSLGQLAVAAAR